MPLVIKLITPAAGSTTCPVCNQAAFGYTGGAPLLAICREGEALQVCLGCAKASAPELAATWVQANQVREARDLMARSGGRGTVGAFKLLGTLLKPDPKRRAPAAPPQREGPPCPVA
jgi:hypothetical protein